MALKHVVIGKFRLRNAFFEIVSIRLHYGSGYIILTHNQVVVQDLLERKY